MWHCPRLVTPHKISLALTKIKNRGSPQCNVVDRLYKSGTFSYEIFNLWRSGEGGGGGRDVCSVVVAGDNDTSRKVPRFLIVCFVWHGLSHCLEQPPLSRLSPAAEPHKGWVGRGGGGHDFRRTCGPPRPLPPFSSSLSLSPSTHTVCIRPIMEGRVGGEGDLISFMGGNWEVRRVPVLQLPGMERERGREGQRGGSYGKLILKAKITRMVYRNPIKMGAIGGTPCQLPPPMHLRPCSRFTLGGDW
ncbi:hypothetical protein H6P81_010986 [Aristolochia fimbriata]|uniref:Uncharacterized protein n=1 Tax=Aristolochia fimbriata TaxID=158543 RepID=A0AAV7ETS4_ARIFI|nr:hypothetical protein H6P81_010986 [Aristolochia fimbriata]